MSRSKGSRSGEEPDLMVPDDDCSQLTANFSSVLADVGFRECAAEERDMDSVPLSVNSPQET